MEGTAKRGPGPAERVTLGSLVDALDRALDASLSQWKTRDVPVTVLFSGGVDSGLLAWELRANAGLRLVTVGVPAGKDFDAAAEGAAVLGVSWRPTEVTRREVLDCAARVDDLFGVLSRTERSVLVAFGLAVGRSPEAAVVCGQGADELFLGYAHFRGLAPEQASARSDLDLDHLVRVDWPRAEELARAMGRRAFAPYLTSDFVDAARRVPISERLPRGLPKELFRRWAIRRGLPESIAFRPKRALQYGSGVARELDRVARPELDSRKV